MVPRWCCSPRQEPRRLARLQTSKDSSCCAHRRASTGCEQKWKDSGPPPSLPFLSHPGRCRRSCCCCRATRLRSRRQHGRNSPPHCAARVLLRPDRASYWDSCTRQSRRSRCQTPGSSFPGEPSPVVSPNWSRETTRDGSVANSPPTALASTWPAESPAEPRSRRMRLGMIYSAISSRSGLGTAACSPVTPSIPTGRSGTTISS